MEKNENFKKEDFNRFTQKVASQAEKPQEELFVMPCRYKEIRN